MASTGAAHDPDSHLCPDGGECGPGTSCTPLLPNTGGYGCCPYGRGVPCEQGPDKGGTTGSQNQHSCCPEGHRCLDGMCVGDDGSLYSPASMVPSIRTKIRSTSCSPPITVKCQDGSTCPTGQSCCQSSWHPSSPYVCCPYGYAQVCCPDGSCCAADYRCEMRWGICVPTLQRAPKTSDNRTTVSGLQGAVPARWGTRARFSSVKPANVSRLECPDGSFCHQGSTCCSARPMSSTDGGGSRYACCPYREAQCCQDEEHCCPRGTRCVHSAAEGHRCQPSDGGAGAASALASKKYPSFTDVPGDTYPSVPCPTWMVCGTGSCCQDRYGAYRCAPYVGGVCCASGISGCPPGTVCFG